MSECRPDLSLSGCEHRHAARERDGICRFDVTTSLFGCGSDAEEAGALLRQC